MATECIETSLLYENNFRFVLPRAPNFTYTVQDIALSGITVGEAPNPTPFLDFERAGEKITFPPLSAAFQVQANLANWLEMFNWMHEMANPDASKRKEHSELYSDGTLFIYDNNNNVISEVIFRDIFPIDLSEINLDARSTAIANATVTLQYSHFEITVK